MSKLSCGTRSCILPSAYKKVALFWSRYNRGDTVRCPHCGLMFYLHEEFTPYGVAKWWERVSR